mmetsp:Transcript_122456/g.391524  ORF Transcript_122456/g.391524 Transcript_122456/m.391524 type:complete len:213 (-) Transcript_122456:1941-2579(-)
MAGMLRRARAPRASGWTRRGKTCRTAAGSITSAATSPRPAAAAKAAEQGVPGPRPRRRAAHRPRRWPWPRRRAASLPRNLAALGAQLLMGNHGAGPGRATTADISAVPAAALEEARCQLRCRAAAGAPGSVGALLQAPLPLLRLAPRGVSVRGRPPRRRTAPPPSPPPTPPPPTGASTRWSTWASRRTENTPRSSGSSPPGPSAALSVKMVS